MLLRPAAKVFLAFNCYAHNVSRLKYSHFRQFLPFQAFQTKGDGRYIMLSAGNNSQFKEICQASVVFLNVQIFCLSCFSLLCWLM